MIYGHKEGHNAHNFVHIFVHYASSLLCPLSIPPKVGLEHRIAQHWEWMWAEAGQSTQLTDGTTLEQIKKWQGLSEVEIIFIFREC